MSSRQCPCGDGRGVGPYQQDEDFIAKALPADQTHKISGYTIDTHCVHSETYPTGLDTYRTVFPRSEDGLVPRTLDG